MRGGNTKSLGAGKERMRRWEQQEDVESWGGGWWIGRDRGCEGCRRVGEEGWREEGRIEGL